MRVNEKLCKTIVLKLQCTCFEYLLESPHWGDSNKYPKPMFYEVIRIEQGLSYTSFCPLRILYNSKFILMAASLGTSAVVVRGFTVISKFLLSLFRALKLLDEGQTVETLIRHPVLRSLIWIYTVCSGRSVPIIIMNSVLLLHSGPLHSNQVLIRLCR